MKLDPEKFAAALSDEGQRLSFKLDAAAMRAVFAVASAVRDATVKEAGDAD